jgi:5-methylcytosine-specific restriction endonuclease McrA
MAGSRFVFTNRNHFLEERLWFWKNKEGDWEEQPDESNKLRLYISGNLINLYVIKRCQYEEQFCEIDPTENHEQSQAIGKKIKWLCDMIFELRKNDFQDRIIAYAEELFYAVDIPPSIQQEEVTPESKKRVTEEVIIQEKQPSTNKNPISSTMKRLVWNINIGEDIGKSKCMCCKTTDITQMSFHCGHVVANAKGGESIVSNLKPICQNCNSSMRTQNMNDFMISLK